MRGMKLRGPLGVVAVIAVACGLAGCAPTNAIVMILGNRTLLNHASTGASADAALQGILGTNVKGCVTIGSNVLVVPGGSSLLPDGSIQIGGTTYKTGSKITLGGGGSDAPPDSRCGPRATYFWVG
jgi:hypothetical protein